MPEVKFGFKAIKPITALHEDREVTYQPGEEVPANEWKGAAVEALIENGKIMRYATNVYAPGEVGGDALPSVTAAPTEADVAPTAARNDGTFPRSLEGGTYELSDGSHVKGKAKAVAAQAALDVASEAA
jgi:hypothetical protein